MQDTQHLFRRENYRQLALFLGTGNILHIPVLAESSFIEKAQGTIAAVCVRTADTLRDDIQEILTYLLLSMQEGDSLKYCSNLFM